MGIEFVTGTRIGVDIRLEELRSKGYMAIYLAVGDHTMTEN